jgi:Tfp pilus assembly protein PilW
MRRRLDIREERGATMVEVLVSIATGMVVLSGLTMVIVVTLHGSARVSARVEATQTGRIAVARVMEQLHSACVAPKIAPIRSASSGSAVRFFRAPGDQADAVAPVPTLTEVRLEGDSLVQTDYATTGTAPNWAETSTVTAGPRTLVSGVSPVTPEGSIFTYYGYYEGALTQVVPSPTLTTGQAATVVEVRLALTATPKSKSPVPDAGAPATIQNSAVLALTPPSFNESANSLPCR